ncbi:MAG: DNA polymerase beta [Alphaproteobacteria bacterium]|nr:DNA polymerase beta [Alphaproteobacteria bacterium]
MLALSDDTRERIAALCRRHRVARLELFGSARTERFDPTRSDADFLVSFEPASRDDLTAYLDFKEGLEALLGRPVDLIERRAIEASRNYIRRRRILGEAEAVFG